jgi:hypothetical protein
MFGNETTLDDLKQAVYSRANVIAEKRMLIKMGGDVINDGWHLLLANGITISIQQRPKNHAEVWAWKGDGKQVGDEVMRDPLFCPRTEQITALAQFLGSN